MSRRSSTRSTWPSIRYGAGPDDAYDLCIADELQQEEDGKQLDLGESESEQKDITVDLTLEDSEEENSPKKRKLASELDEYLPSEKESDDEEAIATPHAADSGIEAGYVF